MIRSAAVLVRERGARGTSIDDVLAHSGAPRGSVYHHFPGGRDELLREATAFAGAYVEHLMASSPGDPAAALDAVLEQYRADLLATGFRAGCPVVAVAIEDRGDDSGASAQAGEVFTRWSRALAASLEASGVRPERAAELADLALAATEGAIVLSRARRDITPFDRVRAELRALLARECPSPSTTPTARPR